MTLLREQVTEFHRVMGQAIADKPDMPSHDVLRLRAALILEEAFEFAEAIFGFIDRDGDGHRHAPIRLKDLHTQALDFVGNAKIDTPDLPDMVDACADIDYVVEGARLALGVDGDPVAAAVHAANMAKAAGPVGPNGKRLKPPGWVPPDIEGELRAQGWRMTAAPATTAKEAP